MRAEREVLLCLYDTESVFAAFRLDGEDVVRPATVYADIDFIRLHLSHVRDGRAQMILQRVADHAGKNVDESIIAQLRQ